MLTDSTKIGAYTFVPDSYLMDFRGRITIPMMGNFLLQAASLHAGARGFGYSDMNEHHTTWVLSRLAIEMPAYPAMGCPITVLTWIDEVGKLFTSRCFEWQTESGETLGYARSIWAAIDIETRRPTLLDVEKMNVYLSDRPCPIAKPGKIAPAEQDTTGDSYTVKYSDLDINGHLNSIKYMEHLLDTFDIDMFRTKEVERFEIAYQAEALYGMELMLHNKPMDDDHYQLSICHEGKAISRAAVTWKRDK